MITVKKSNTIPKSLTGNVTKKRRNEIIAKGKYPKSSTISIFSASSVKIYDGRYRVKDIKLSLSKTYNSKCAFCEQKVEQYHVDHFRPKSIYYWLAYSWDNLLYCCPKCNEHKSNKFPVKTRANITSVNISDIHKLRDKYDTFEENKFINPEKENIYSSLIFEKNGHILSENNRVQTTITELKIDRTWLKEQRKEIYSEFEQKIISRQAEYKLGKTDALIKLKGFIEDFIEESENEVKEYLSFRKYIVKNWLTNLIS